MNRKIINILFFLIAFTLCFIQIPDALRGAPKFVSALHDKLSLYPIIAGMIYTVYCQVKYKNVFVKFNVFFVFILIYFFISVLSLLIGLNSYPYYNDILNAKITQVDNLQYFINILASFNIRVDAKEALMYYLFLRTIKGIILEIVYTFGCSYMIFCWYYKNWREAFRVLIKAILLSLSIIFCYSLVEILYLAGNNNAKSILEVVNPYIHVIKTTNNWWPPLLWPKQLRSIFPEPSFFSIWSAFALPFIWYQFFKTDRFYSKLFYTVLILIFHSLLFLTQARTAMGLLIGEFVLLSLFAVILRNKRFMLRYFMVLSCTICAFLVVNLFIANVYHNYSNNIKNTNLISTIENYTDKNINSMTGISKRSNGARFATIYANIKIGMDNPIFGVGKGLVPAYMPERLPAYARENKEVNVWVKEIHEFGILKVGFPSFCEYTFSFAERGLLGLFIMYLPLTYLLWKILQNLKLNKFEFGNIFLLISILGICATGFSNMLNVTYCYWILLGLGYARIYNKN